MPLLLSEQYGRAAQPLRGRRQEARQNAAVTRNWSQNNMPDSAAPSKSVPSCLSQVHVAQSRPYMKLVLLPLSSILDPIAVSVIQPEGSNAMSLAIQPIAFVLVFVLVCHSSAAYSRRLASAVRFCELFVQSAASFLPSLLLCCQVPTYCSPDGRKRVALGPDFSVCNTQESRES